MTAASHAARAMALAAHRLGAVAALARIAGPDGAAARAMSAASAIAAGPDLAAPRPSGWRTVHPSWVDAALEGAPAAVVAAVRSDDTSSHARYLARLYLGALTPMLSRRPAAPGLALLVRFDNASLTRALSIIGRRQLAYALSTSAARSIAELAARLPWGSLLMGDVAAISVLADPTPRFGSRAGVHRRTVGLVWSDPLALPRAGARAIAAAVAAEPDLAAHLAQRLARPVGLVVAAELATFATPADGVNDAEIKLAVLRVAGDRSVM